MANSSIEIEIVANFKDNATEKVKTLNSELDKLEKRNVDINVGTTDRASTMLNSIDSKLNKIDGSKATQAIDDVTSRADAVTDNIHMVGISADTSQFDSALNSVKHQLDGIGDSTVKVSPKNIWPDSIFHPYNEGVSDTSELSDVTEALEEIPRSQQRAFANKYNGYDQSAIDSIEEYVNKHAGLSNSQDIPDNFWTAVTTQFDKEQYRTGQMSALALAQFGAVNPDALNSDDRAEYDKFMGIRPNSSIADDIPTTSSSGRYRQYNSAEIEDFINAHVEGGVAEDVVDIGGIGGFWGRISPEIDKNYMVKRMARMGKMFGSTAESVKGQALAGLGVTAGMAVAGTALASAGSDLYGAYTSENRNDAERSLARGLTKGAMTLIGGGIGTIIAPGVGTMIGAGIGGSLSNIFGDDLADSISGITKSAEELKQERLDEIFGDIAMSAEDLNKVAQTMIGTWSTQVSQAHQQALSTGYSLQENTDSSYFGVVESGSKLDIKGNLGFHIPDEEFSSYETQVNDYMDSIEKTMSQEMYNAFMVNDDLFGYGQWDTSGLSEKYKTAFENFAKQKEELGKYLELALSDKNFSPDEREHVFSTIHGMQQNESELSLNESEIKQGTFDWLSQNGLLSQDSYNSLQKALWENTYSTIQNAAETRQNAILNGANEIDANKAAFEIILPAISGVMSSSLGGLTNQYSDSISNARVAYWDDTQSFLDNPEQWKGFMDYIGDDYSSLGREIQDKGMAYMLGFNQIDDNDKELLSDEYKNNILPYLDTVESTARQAKALNMDTSDIDKKLLESYEIGAMGGDPEAQQKYMAGLFAGNDALSQMVTQAMSTIEGREKFSDAFQEAWNLFNDTSDPYNISPQDPYDIPTDNKGNAEIIQQQADRRQQAVETTSQETAQVIQEGTQMQTDAINEGNSAMEKSISSFDPTKFSIGKDFISSLKSTFGMMDFDFSKLSIGQDFISGLQATFGTAEPIEAPLQVKPKFEVAFGNFDNSFLDLPEVSTEVTIEGTANYELGTYPEEVPDATGEANYTGNFPSSAPTIYGSVVYTPVIGGVGAASNAAKFNMGTFHWAKGTLNAPEGLAYVNDDGSAEPYELIEHDGEFRMYDGRNVLTMLERGDRVYTSSQTKDILSGRSIPHYAQGLNNDVIDNKISTVQGASSDGVNVTISPGAVTVSITVSGNNGSIVEEIKSHSTEIAEVVADELNRHLSAIYANSPNRGT